MASLLNRGSHELPGGLGVVVEDMAIDYIPGHFGHIANEERAVDRSERARHRSHDYHLIGLD